MKNSTKHLSIGFIPEMAVAALRAENPKTLTTRMSGLDDINEAPDEWTDHYPNEPIVVMTRKGGTIRIRVACRYAPGERRALLTTWAVPRCLDNLRPTQLGSAGFVFWHAGMGPKPEWAGKSRPGNFLPGAVRHLMPTVEITGVSIARMQDITEAQAVAEGVEAYPVAHLTTGQKFLIDAPCMDDATPFRNGFALVITSINKPKKGKPDPWRANLWCWRIAFKLLSRGEAMS